MSNSDNNRIRRRKVSSSGISNPTFNNDSARRNNQQNRLYEENKEKLYREKQEKLNQERQSKLNHERQNNRINHERQNNKINRANKSSIKEQDEKLGSRNQRKKRQRKKYMFKFLKVAFSIMLVGLIILSTAGVAFTMISVKDSPKVTKELVDSKYVSSMPVSINKIPQNLKNAVVAIEDERFYKHKGVDVISLTRSLLNNIFSDTTQGGSTIDMQVSKNLLTDNDRTIKRKVKDIYNARNMNKVMTKDEILEAYLNNIYLGKSTYGVGKGAKVYFGKDVSELNLAQCAMLAGITNNPGRYVNHDEAKKRQEVVLYKMHELKYITDKEYNDALYDPVPFSSEIE